MKFRRPATLVATFEDGQIVLHNFLTRDRFACSAEYLEFLAKLDEWTMALKICSHIFPILSVSVWPVSWSSWSQLKP